VADQSSIEWTDATWTPIRARRRDTGKVGVHCERVSPACTNCYAAALNRRNLPNHGTGLDFTVPNREMVDIFVDEEMLMAPLRWKRPRNIFVCSQTDLFLDSVDEEQIAMLFAVMGLAHWHTHQVLSKRSERMLKLLLSMDFWELVDSMMTVIVDGEVDPLERRRDDLRATAPEVSPDMPLPNVWLGVTAENQEWADKRIPLLLQTPAARRFVSVEPMLGPVNVRGYLMSGKDPGQCLSCGKGHGFDRCPNYGRVAKVMHGTAGNCSEFRRANFAIDWVICGGESGPGARPMHPDWARSLRDQCAAAGVPFFFKQWGAWQNGSDKNWNGRIVLNDGRSCDTPEDLDMDTRNRWPSFRPMKMSRVGKHAAGRLLDGREWSEFPEVLNVTK